MTAIDKPLAELQPNDKLNTTATEQTKSQLFSKTKVMDWQSVSEVVGGFVQREIISKDTVNPDWFFPPYDNFIKEIKAGIDKPEDLIERCELSVFQACNDAAESQKGSQSIDWLRLLRKSYHAARIASEAEKVGKQLRSGKPADLEAFDLHLKELNALKTDDGFYGGHLRYTVRTAKNAFEPYEPIPFIIDGMFQEGSVSVIAGDGGTFKTYLMLCASVAVASGKDFLNLETIQSNVLYINAEMNDASFTHRVRATLNGLEADENAPLNWISLPGFNLMDESDLGIMKQEIQVCDAKLVIIDALSDIMPGGDENLSKDMTQLFLGLRQVAAETSCAIVIIHHMNKSGGYRGSSDIKNKPDNLWIIKVDEDTNEMTIKPEKVRDGKPKTIHAKINFELEQGEFQKVYVTTIEPSKDKSGSRLTPKLQEVLDIIAQNPNVTMNEICQKTINPSEPANKVALGKLKELGLVIRPDGDDSKIAHYVTTDWQWQQKQEPAMTDDELVGVFDD